MPIRRPRPCTIAWAAIIGLTAATYRLSEGPPQRILMVCVLALTLAKGQLVVDYFMGLRRVRPIWRAALASYLVLVTALIAAPYLLS
ncbi:MAG: cytochrome C oxidase subunit IV family protein [Betaproteobacteria bacterium]|nr:cytochrome C oxidase subunit IV family protein [Betaproteobacteria bacterium]